MERNQINFALERWRDKTGREERMSFIATLLKRKYLEFY